MEIALTTDHRLLRRDKATHYRPRGSVVDTRSATDIAAGWLTIIGRVAGVLPETPGLRERFGWLAPLVSHADVASYVRAALIEPAHAVDLLDTLLVKHPQLLGRRSHDGQREALRCWPWSYDELSRFLIVYAPDDKWTKEEATDIAGKYEWRETTNPIGRLWRWVSGTPNTVVSPQCAIDFTKLPYTTEQLAAISDVNTVFFPRYSPEFHVTPDLLRDVTAIVEE